MTAGAGQTTAPHTAGQLRDQLWGSLMRTRVATYPLPPHGHHPNFRGARQAAGHLLAHPRLLGLHTLIVGPERALQPFRKLALQEGRALYVPNQKKDGWYWRLTDPAGADLRRMPELGEPKLRPEGAQAAVLACVAAARDGGRLSKGYGWAWNGLPSLPAFTLAHPAMLLDTLPCPPDSRVELIGTLNGVIKAR